MSKIIGNVGTIRRSGDNKETNLYLAFSGTTMFLTTPRPFALTSGSNPVPNYAAGIADNLGLAAPAANQGVLSWQVIDRSQLATAIFEKRVNGNQSIFSALQNILGSTSDLNSIRDLVLTAGQLHELKSAYAFDNLSQDVQVYLYSSEVPGQRVGVGYVSSSVFSELGLSQPLKSFGSNSSPSQLIIGGDPVDLPFVQDAYLVGPDSSQMVNTAYFGGTLLKPTFGGKTYAQNVKDDPILTILITLAASETISFMLSGKTLTPIGAFVTGGTSFLGGEKAKEKTKKARNFAKAGVRRVVSSIRKNRR